MKSNDKDYKKLKGKWCIKISITIFIFLLWIILIYSSPDKFFKDISVIKIAVIFFTILGVICAIDLVIFMMSDDFSRMTDFSSNKRCDNVINHKPKSNDIFKSHINIIIKIVIAPLTYILLFLSVMIIPMIVIEHNKLTTIDFAVLVFGVILFGHIGLLLYFTFLHSNLILTQDYFFISSWSNWFIGIDVDAKYFKELRLPKVIKTKIDIDNIQTIVFGNIALIKKHCENIQNEVFFEKLSNFKKNTKSLTFARMGLNIKEYIFVYEKNKESHMADVSMFSTNSVREILLELEKCGIDVVSKM